MLARTVQVLAVLAAGVLSGSGASARAPQPAAQDTSARSAQLATFDAAWEAIRASFVDERLPESEWDRLHAELRPRAAAARTDHEVRQVLADLIGRIGRSHFALLPAPAADTATRAAAGTAEPGFHLSPVGERFVVTRVDPGTPAALAGVRPGWTVEAIDGDAPVAPAAGGAAAFRAWAVAITRLRGAEGSRVRVTFLDATDRRTELDLPRSARRGQIVSFGHLPPHVAELESTRLDAPGGAPVVCIRYNIWMTAIAPALERAVHDARDADGIVIDLRQNPGGVLTMLMGVSGYFLDAPASLGTLRTRESELRIVANPRRTGPAGEPVTPYAGPLAILVDETSFSASEIFAAGMQAIGRARVFGTRTPGGALPAMIRRLPNGDVLEYAIGDFVAADGRRIEGHGVVPDVEVRHSRASLLAGVDAPLAAALEWMGARETRVTR